MNEFISRIDKIANLMKNFSNKDKLSILCALGKNEKNVSEIMSCLTISQSQVSQYLGKMKLEGILESEKKGKEVYYRISDNKILELIAAMKVIFNK